MGERVTGSPSHVSMICGSHELNPARITSLGFFPLLTVEFEGVHVWEIFSYPSLANSVFIKVKALEAAATTEAIIIFLT